MLRYAGTRTRIDITDFEDLSDAQDAIKAKYGEDIPAPAARIQLYDQQGQLIADLDDIAIEKLHNTTETG
ncbi:hypothetical protein BSLG_005856 [Batrachochytrium salamandrivorans]|nr:hypothetical protein BSLG_005856 [Batrachochytrium salamandrivorans]